MNESKDTKKNTIPKEKITKTFFDTDFFSDPKIEYITSEHGPAAVTYYLKIVLAILSEGGALNRRIARSFLVRFGLDAAAAEVYIDDCMAVGLLYQEADDLRSARADREILALVDKRDKWRKKQETYRDKKETLSSVTRDKEETNGRHSVDSEKEEEEEREQELENEQEGEQEPPLPPQLSDPVSREALADWLAYKRERRQSYKPKGYRALLAKLVKDNLTALALRQAVDHSMANAYQGLFAPTQPRGSQGRLNASGYSEAFEHNLRLIQRLGGEEK